MKIKYWLMCSYLIVMLLPIIFLFLLISMVQSYDNKQEMLDYMEVQEKLDLYDRLLNNPELYSGRKHFEYDRLDSYTLEQTTFTLYDNDGFILFSTGPNSEIKMKKKKDEVYQGLYELKPSYKSFEYKRPVFSNEKLVGFYEITFLRVDWLRGVEKRQSYAITLYIAFFIIVYLLAIYLLKKKLFTPLRLLMNAMSAFAKGEENVSVPRKKDEIGDLITHFEKMQAEIKEKEAAILTMQEQKQYMIASISHDIKTPLTAIRTSAEGLLDDGIDRNLRNNKLNMILTKTDYIHQLIDDLTIYNLLQSSHYSLETVEVEGQEFFEMVLSDYDTLASTSGIQLSTHIDVNGNYLVNTKQLLRLFDNLIINAIHHTKKGGSIWCCAFSNDRKTPEFLFSEAKEWMNTIEMDSLGVWLVVQNEGEAVPLLEQKKLFEPLYQGDPSRTKKTNQGNRGSGLGLSISKMIIEKLGGEIIMTSSKGDGNTFICFLPECNSSIKEQI